MQRKRKKFWIIFSSICASIFAACIIFCLITRLSMVSVEFYPTRLGEEETMLSSNIKELVSDSADFEFGKSLLFINVDKNIKKIEKENPFVKVEKVVRKFPNRITVYISERKAIFRVKDKNEANKWYVLDEDFKVLGSYILGSVDTLTDGKDVSSLTTIELKNISVSTFVGDFLDMSNYKANILKILSGVYGKTTNYFSIGSIRYDSEVDTYYIVMRNDESVEEEGCVLKIVGTENLENKVFYAMNVYTGDDFDEDDPTGLNNKMIETTQEADGTITSKIVDKS